MVSYPDKGLSFNRNRGDIFPSSFPQSFTIFLSAMVFLFYLICCFLTSTFAFFEFIFETNVCFGLAHFVKMSNFIKREKYNSAFKECMTGKLHLFILY